VDRTAGARVVLPRFDRQGPPRPKYSGQQAGYSTRRAGGAPYTKQYRNWNYWEGNNWWKWNR
jgi:hypothetical protein